MPADSLASGPRRFPTTRWTLILSAQNAPEERETALGELLGCYWKPLYFFVRRRGLDADAAQDAVQGFIAHLLARDFLARLDPDKGRLRSFLRTAIKHFLISEHEKGAAQKRGGGVAPMPLDFEVAESELSHTPADPDAAYERAWALAIMSRALERLREEFERGERSGPFELVEQFFGFGETPSYREAAAAHGMTVPQLKAFLHRARARFRQLVEDQTRDTVPTDADVHPETKELLGGLAG